MSAVALPVSRVLAAGVAVLLPLSVVSTFGVNIGKALLVAMVRCAVQLILLGGLVLAPLVKSTHPELILGYAAVMVPPPPPPPLFPSHTLCMCSCVGDCTTHHPLPLSPRSAQSVTASTRSHAPPPAPPAAPPSALPACATPTPTPCVTSTGRAYIDGVAKDRHMGGPAAPPTSAPTGTLMSPPPPPPPSSPRL